MKKLPLIIFVLALIFGTGQSIAQSAHQSVFYDAAFLRDSCFSEADGTLTGRANVLAIISYYDPSVNNLNLDNSLRKNPFLAPIAGQQVAQAGTNPSYLHDAVSSIGGIDVTQLSTAVADLLIERAKQELTIAFFDRFKAFVSDPKHPEFATLFPKTTDALNNLLSYEYPKMLPTLRTAFFADLKQITYHTEQLLLLQKYQPLLKKFPEVLIAIKAVNVYHDLESGTSNSAEVLHELANYPYLTTLDQSESTSNFVKNMHTLLRLADFFSESLRTKSDETTKIWVGSDDLKRLVSDEVMFRMYMGLIWQEVHAQDLIYYADGNPLRVDTVLGKQAANILYYQSKIAEFGTLSEQLNTLVAKSKAGTLTDSDKVHYVDLSLNATDYVFDLIRHFDSHFDKDNAIVIPQKAAALYKDIYTKQYTQAVTDGVDLLNQVQLMVHASKNWKKGDTTSKFDDFVNFTVKVRPYAVFIANVAEAKTSDDVKTALNNVILPVGSYTIKEKAAWNVSVNGYLGFAADYNKFLKFNDPYANGLFAPIGFTLTRGTKHPYGVPVTVFAGLFDLGNLVKYRLENNTALQDKQVKLESIWSPSAYFLLDVPKLPLAIGAGWRRTPKLFYSDNSNFTTIPSRDVFSITAIIDIPFFTLYNHPIGQ